MSENIIQGHLAKLIRESAKNYAECSALKIKKNGEWFNTNYKQMLEQIDALVAAFMKMSVKKGENIAIFSGNKREWPIADFAIQSLRAVTVPIYGTNTAKQTEYIVKDASIRIIFVGDQSQYDKAIEIKNNSSLQIIIAMEDEIKISGQDSYYMTSLINENKDNLPSEEIEKILSEATSDELCTLIYTSGTTGDPKGVMLNHLNFFHQIDSITAEFNLSSNDRSLAFIPLSHVYERAWSYVVFYKGMQNNYCEDPKLVIDTMKEVNPTAMVSVPRLYEKIYATIWDRLASAPFIRRMIFKWSLWVGFRFNKRKYRKRWIGPMARFHYSIADKLVLKKIRALLGGDKNFFSAGGAPLSKDIEEFFLSVGLLVCQGYGLTETSPVIACNTPSAFKFGTVGKPLSGVDVKIDLETGEILAKGPNLTCGYYNKPELTTEAFTKDGWFKTGDVGGLDKEGYLVITDRIKDFIITSSGKNVAPLRIETIVGVDHYIEQICTIGDKRKYISALVVPNFPALEEFAKSQNISFVTREELIANPKIIDFYKERIDLASVELSQFEKIKKFHLLAKEFSQENGEITPTLKIKRKIIASNYAEIIEKLYAED